MNPTAIQKSDPTPIVLRRIRNLLREAMRSGPNPSVMRPIVDAMKEITALIGD